MTPASRRAVLATRTRLQALRRCLTRFPFRFRGAPLCHLPHPDGDRRGHGWCARAPRRQPVRRLSTTKVNKVGGGRYWVCYDVSTQPLPPMTRANAPPMANRGPSFLVQSVMARLALKPSRSSLPLGPKVRKSPMGKVRAPNTTTAKNALFTRESFAEVRRRLLHPTLSGART